MISSFVYKKIIQYPLTIDHPSQVELHFSGLRSKKSLVVPTYFVDCHKTAISYCVTVLPQKTIFVISAFSLYHTNPTAAPSLIIFAASFSVTFL